MFNTFKCNVVETPLEAKIRLVSRFIESPCQEDSKISQRNVASNLIWCANLFVCL